jgi:hypothetical protein
LLVLLLWLERDGGQLNVRSDTMFLCSLRLLVCVDASEGYAARTGELGG